MKMDVYQRFACWNPISENSPFTTHCYTNDQNSSSESVLSQIWLFLLQTISVRVVADIPHPRYKIQVFLYNAKYMVKIELGQFEQVYKIAEGDVNGLEDVKRMVTEDLLKNALDRFLTMRTDWETAFKQK